MKRRVTRADDFPEEEVTSASAEADEHALIAAKALIDYAIMETQSISPAAKRAMHSLIHRAIGILREVVE